MDGLISRDVFTLVHQEDTKGHRRNGRIFVEEVKNEGLTAVVGKASLVYQSFNEKVHKLMTYAPAVQRASQRLLLSLFDIQSELQLFYRDIL